jgi:hypothetical protein
MIEHERLEIQALLVDLAARLPGHVVHVELKNITITLSPLPPVASMKAGARAKDRSQQRARTSREGSGRAPAQCPSTPPLPQGSRDAVPSSVPVPSSTGRRKTPSRLRRELRRAAARLAAQAEEPRVSSPSAAMSDTTMLTALTPLAQASRKRSRTSRLSLPRPSSPTCISSSLVPTSGALEAHISNLDSGIQNPTSAAMTQLQIASSDALTTPLPLPDRVGIELPLALTGCKRPLDSSGVLSPWPSDSAACGLVTTDFAA